MAQTEVLKETFIHPKPSKIVLDEVQRCPSEAIHAHALRPLDSPKIPDKTQGRVDLEVALGARDIRNCLQKSTTNGNSMKSKMSMRYHQGKVSLGAIPKFSKSKTARHPYPVLYGMNVLLQAR